MIDLDELRGLARETGSDNYFYAPADEDNAAMLYEAADEIETLRASESALKAENLALKRELGDTLDDWNGKSYGLMPDEIEKNEDRIQQLENELKDQAT